jgi:hypothetical protein
MHQLSLAPTLAGRELFRRLPFKKLASALIKYNPMRSLVRFKIIFFYFKNALAYYNVRGSCKSVGLAPGLAAAVATYLNENAHF